VTSFQERCEAQLLQRLKDVGRYLVNREILGTRERYVHASVNGSDLEVWIYEDEAQVSAPGLDDRFEAADFVTDQQLIDAFIDDVASAIASRACSEPGR
jgi:hypothetical protein